MITNSVNGVEYISVPIKENQTGNTLSQNISTVVNSNKSICSQMLQVAKYALTAGVGILAVAAVTYAATHGFFSIDFGTRRGNSASMAANGLLGLEVINQLNQGETPDHIPSNFYRS